jgi:uncharacterized protein YegJ (DUF2314 family)
MSWFKKQYRGAASVLFRGNLMPRAEEFASLAARGITLRPGKATDECQWSLHLSHPTWGEADVLAMRGFTPPPPTVVEMAPGLTAQDREEIGSAGTGLAVTNTGARQDVPLDRKGLLFFARAVMGDEGVGVADHASMLFWTRQALDDELCHGAPLDVNQLHTIHAVYGEKAPRNEDGEPVAEWVHTHGLAELGGWDFDVLRPSAACLESSLPELMRALAFASLEGIVKPGAVLRLSSLGGVRFIDAAEFQRSGLGMDILVREGGNDHTDRRVIVCEPAKKGLLGIRARTPLGASLFRLDDYEGILIAFSDEATDLMARRARDTIGVFASFLDEFADLHLPALVKLGLETSDGGREHPWFLVERVAGGMVHGTCANEPFDIPNLHEGDQGAWPAELASDWTIQSPVGTLTPRSMRAAADIRANREQIARFMREHQNEFDA